MFVTMKYKNLFGVMLSLALLAGSAAAKTSAPPLTGDDALTQKAIHEVRMYPYYGVFDDVNVRKAFSMATDRKQLVNTLLDGAATVGNDTYISPKLDWADTSLKTPEFNIEAARKAAVRALDEHRRINRARAHPG